MADDEAINNLHDRLFRETFAHTESLCGFVRAYAPADVAALIDGPGRRAAILVFPDLLNVAEGRIVVERQQNRTNKGCLRAISALRARRILIKEL